MSTGGTVPSGLALALLNLTVQRASRSFCRSLAGLAFQASGMRPSLIAFFSSSVLRCLGAGISEASTIWPAHGDVPGLAQRRVEPVEQRLDRLGPGQLLAEQPDRAGVGNPVGQAQPEKPHERQAVIDQKLGALVGEGVRRLNHQDLEHHHRVERRSAALRTVRVGQRPRQLGPEHVEIHRRREGQQLIAQIAQPPQALVDVEKPRLTAHRLTPLHHQRRNQKLRQMARFLEPLPILERF